MRKAFTAIELLVVLAIVSILAAVLLAGMVHGWWHRGGHRPSYKMSCISNVKNIGLGFAMYENDHRAMPNVKAGADTGALGLGLLREGRYIDSDAIFACPAWKTEPEWDSIRAYRDALSRGFNRRGDRWHAKTLGYDYDNTVPHAAEPMRVIAADKDTSHHEDGSIALFMDKHAEYLKEGAVLGEVPNRYLSDTDIYQGTPGEEKDCFLNGPDTDDR